MNEAVSPPAATPSIRDKLGYQAGLLGGVCALVSLLLLGGNLMTTETIDLHLDNDKKVLLEQVLPASLYDNDPLQESESFAESVFFSQPVTLYTARRQQFFSAVAIQAATPGWGGQIDFIVGINAAGAITGVRVINHRETPGLADKIELDKSDWITGFNGHSLANTPEPGWAVKKDGGQFDQFTGATITPRAVVKGVYQSMQFYEDWLKRDHSRSPQEEP
ncbi:MAG: electron transport complex subunit RsxG [Gammaproteobacteria bacterium]|nr:MAG: electron transport complex subunit RsxG [Gammaproteobacteria bacterium]